MGGGGGCNSLYKPLSAIFTNGINITGLDFKTELYKVKVFGTTPTSFPGLSPPKGGRRKTLGTSPWRK